MALSIGMYIILYLLLLLLFVNVISDVKAALLKYIFPEGPSQKYKTVILWWFNS